MQQVNLTLDNLNEILTSQFTPEQTAKAKTFFLKHLSEHAHRFYGGKMQTVPKAGPRRSLLHDCKFYCSTKKRIKYFL